MDTLCPILVRRRFPPTSLPERECMAYRAWFQCLHCDDQRYPLDEIVYECRECGGLLEVRHDMDALRHRSPYA